MLCDISSPFVFLQISCHEINVLSHILHIEMKIYTVHFKFSTVKSRENAYRNIIIVKNIGFTEIAQIST